MDMVKHKVLWMTLAAAVLVGVGCGDDDGGGTDAGKDAGPTGPVTTEMCIATAKELGSNAPQSTIDCLCDKCLEAMTACDEDPGCVEIRDCSDRTGCRGATDCYLFPVGDAKECKTIIDKYGATGLSATLSQQLSDCNAAMCEVKPDAGGKDAAMSEEDASSGDSGAEDAGN